MVLAKTAYLSRDNSLLYTRLLNHSSKLELNVDQTPVVIGRSSYLMEHVRIVQISLENKEVDENVVPISAIPAKSLLLMEHVNNVFHTQDNKEKKGKSVVQIYALNFIN